ncbi:MAG: class I SAM-dependent methyltransferase [Rubrivivax sp.]|jgi:2-polyprenyl-6-hydroxyphenyl methylase/3-demethylubiquinone-9 3-methyltransferase|nr:class I SAM-dependent methyltransferase [Rubrivivax sp.]
MPVRDLLDKLPACPAAEAPCKVCGAASPLFDVCDFMKNCEQRRDAALGRPLAGVPIYYYRCPACGFLFTIAFDGLGEAELGALVYNDDYVRYDPDFAEARPREMARVVRGLVGDSLLSRLSILDYGGGNGRLRDFLREAGGRHVESYDPYFQDGAPQARFDLVLCFEVLEHSRAPRRLVADLRRMLGPAGVVIFSTLLQPPDIAAQGVQWWYVAPRNGHVSIHTGKSLRDLFACEGLDVLHGTNGLHVALTRPRPDFVHTGRDASGRVELAFRS